MRRFTKGIAGPLRELVKARQIPTRAGETGATYQRGVTGTRHTTEGAREGHGGETTQQTAADTTDPEEAIPENIIKRYHTSKLTSFSNGPKAT